MRGPAGSRRPRRIVAAKSGTRPTHDSRVRSSIGTAFPAPGSCRFASHWIWSAQRLSTVRRATHHSARTARRRWPVNWSAPRASRSWEVRYVAGPNEGRAVRTDAHGRFAAVDLHPGLSLIEVRAHDRRLARREVRLPAGIESRFHLALAQPARVAGRVVDTKGAALAGALVRIDGQSLFTDAAGAFDTPAVPAGGDRGRRPATAHGAPPRRRATLSGRVSAGGPLPVSVTWPLGLRKAPRVGGVRRELHLGCRPASPDGE